MKVEFTNQQLREAGSAFPGRLLKFRLRRNNFEGLVLSRHAVPDQRFAEGAASLGDRFFEVPTRDSFETSKQPVGFAMQTEFSDERCCGSGSAFPGRLLKFRLRRNNFEGLVLSRHAVPDQRFAEGPLLAIGFRDPQRFIRDQQAACRICNANRIFRRTMLREWSAFPGRLLKFRLWRNNFEGLFFPARSAGSAVCGRAACPIGFSSPQRFIRDQQAACRICNANRIFRRTMMREWKRLPRQAAKVPPPAEQFRRACSFPARSAE